VIVWVASYPRSASKLTMLTLDRAFGFKRALSSQPDRTRDRFGIRPDAELLPTLAELDEPIFLKTHALPEQGDESPVLYLIRDGRDAVVSHAHYVLDRGKRTFKGLDFPAALERIIRRGHAVKARPGQVPPGVTWSDHVRFWTSHPAPTALVRFEELIQDPPAVISGALRSLPVDVPEPKGEVPSFEELRRQRDPVVYRRGKTGGWKEEMSPQLEALFWKLHGSQMEALGYPRR
jgi:hypothetical protein